MTKPVSRLGGKSDAAGDDILEREFAGIIAKRGTLLNIHKVVGLAPKILRAQATYADQLRDESSLARDFQELMILRIAQVNQSEYEQSVHKSIALSCGVSQEKIDALSTWRMSSAFGNAERAALAFVEQAGDFGDVDDPTFEALRLHFSPQQIVELAALIAWYVGNARFVRALQIRSEPK